MSDEQKPPRNAQRLRSMLRAYDRTPFIELLETLLLAAPSAEVLEEFAKKSPDKYLQGLKITAGLGGFQEVSALDVMISRPEELSDSQLEDRIRQRVARLKAMGTDLEAEPQKVLAEPMPAEPPKED